MSYIKKWVCCPICGGKTRLQLLETTELKDFPLFCPKCKQEMLIKAEKYHVRLISQTH
ncbi:MAG: cysteine-rich KTR domain-containing protein [Anaerovoracaceae bacterium]